MSAFEEWWNDLGLAVAADASQEELAWEAWVAGMKHAASLIYDEAYDEKDLVLVSPE